MCLGIFNFCICTSILDLLKPMDGRRSGRDRGHGPRQSQEQGGDRESVGNQNQGRGAKAGDQVTPAIKSYN